VRKFLKIKMLGGKQIWERRRRRRREKDVHYIYGPLYSGPDHAVPVQIKSFHPVSYIGFICLPRNELLIL